MDNTTTGTKAPGKRILGDHVQQLLLQHPNVIAWINGHTQVNNIRLLLVLGGLGGDRPGVVLADDEVDHGDEVAVGAVPAGTAFRGLDQ
jgi:hypothetical protein